MLVKGVVKEENLCRICLQFQEFKLRILNFQSQR